MKAEYFEFLKSCFVEWGVKDAEKNTIRGLSRSTGVGKNVICDMANGVVKNSKYAFQDVSQYLKKIAVTKEVYIEFMTEYYQDFIALAEQFMLDKEEIYYSNPQVLQLMNQSQACEIFQNCITKRGMSRDEIKRDHGGAGLHIVDVFLKNEILREEGSWIRHSYSENVVFDNTLSNRLIESNVSEFDLRGCEKINCNS